MSTSRLQLATKIHFYLLRELGHGIDVEQMLHSDLYARDVLLVCEACRGTGLADLAGQFRRAMPQPAAASAKGGGAGRTARPLEWAQDTSGFGFSRPPLSEPERSGPQATTQARRAWWRWN
ncbi:MAG: hypothetical protein ACKVQR_17960 [Aquabacterium sp.]